MKRSMFLVALLILVPLTAATVHAQGTGPIDLSLSPSSGSVAVANTTTSTLTVTNDALQPMTISLSASEPTGVGVTYSRNSFTLLPTQSTDVMVSFKAKTNDSLGTHDIKITARDTAFGGSDDATRTFKLNVTPMYIPAPKANATNGTGGADDSTAPPAPMAPKAEPGDVNLTVAPGESAGVTVAISNPASFPQNFTVAESMPEGWTLDGAPTTLALGGFERRVFSLTIAVAASAGHGEGLLTFANGSVSDAIAFHLRVASSAGSSSNEDDAANEPADKGSTPANGTGSGGSTSNSSSRASGEVGPPGLLFEPARVDIVPGGRADVVLTLTSNQPSARAVEFDVVTPDGLRLEMPASPVDLPAWEIIEVTMKLEADDDLETGAFRFITIRMRDEADVKVTVPVKVNEDVPLQPASLSPETSQDRGTPVRMNSGLIIGGTAIAGGLVALLVAFLVLRRAAATKKPDLGRAIEGIAKRRPGIKADDLREALDVPASAFESSLKKLVKGGSLALLDDGDSRRVYPVDAAPASVAKPIAGAPAAASARPAEKPVHERAFRVIVEKGPLTANQLAVALGVPGATLEHHVERLVIAGRIQVRIENGQRVLDLPQPGST